MHFHQNKTGNCLADCRLFPYGNKNNRHIYPPDLLMLSGTMEEFDELLAEAKKRDMYIIMDLVINHCSDQHEWFHRSKDLIDLIII